MPKFDTKNAWFGYFWPKFPYLGFCGKNFKKAIAIFEISISNLSSCKISRKNKNTWIWDQKCLIWIFLTKNALFGYFWARILKKLLSYLKSAPSNLSICKISRKNKNAYIWDQICLFCVFLGWNLKTILSYLKSAPSNLSNCKIW